MSGRPVTAVLDEARRLGFLGPGPVEVHVDHALGFASVADPPPDRALDLGSGGGVPGLVLAGHWPGSRWVLLDAAARRAAFLADAVTALGLADRVRVVEARAEAAGRDPSLRAGCDLVTARSFASPAVTAECAAPFLRVGGALVVSEPPEAEARWPAAPLGELGLQDEGRHRSGSAYQRLRQVTPCPERYPRRVGIPAKRPLF